LEDALHVPLAIRHVDNLHGAASKRAYYLERRRGVVMPVVTRAVARKWTFWSRDFSPREVQLLQTTGVT
jgi:hypothetical protein